MMNAEIGNGSLKGKHVPGSKLGGEILQFATFHLNGELFGLNILQVQEIQLPQSITPIPRAADHILGLISLRGHIVTLIDLRRMLGMDLSQPIAKRFHIVVNLADTIASFEVGEVGDVIDVPSDKFVPPPGSVRAVDAKFLKGIYPMQNRILSVLNLETILDLS